MKQMSQFVYLTMHVTIKKQGLCTCTFISKALITLFKMIVAGSKHILGKDLFYSVTKLIAYS